MVSITNSLAKHPLALVTSFQFTAARNLLHTDHVNNAHSKQLQAGRRNTSSKNFAYCCLITIKPASLLQKHLATSHGCVTLVHSVPHTLCQQY